MLPVFSNSSQAIFAALFSRLSCIDFPSHKQFAWKRKNYAELLFQVLVAVFTDQVGAFAPVLFHFYVGGKKDFGV